MTVTQYVTDEDNSRNRLMQKCIFSKKWRKPEMTTLSVKEEARRLVEALPDQASWEDLMYRIYVRQKIERGLKDAEEGRLVSQEEVEKLFLGK